MPRLPAPGRFFVAGCGSSRNFSTLMSATKFARRESRKHGRGGCFGTTVWKMETANRGKTVMTCEKGFCQPGGPRVR
jgi:hypothetical protein